MSTELSFPFLGCFPSVQVFVAFALIKYAVLESFDVVGIGILCNTINLEATSSYPILGLLSISFDVNSGKKSQKQS